jgi:DNA-binding transcriptional MerR regulator
MGDCCSSNTRRDRAPLSLDFTSRATELKRHRMAGQRRKRTRERKPRDEKIIHVVFGPGGGRVPEESTVAAASTDDGGVASSREPVTDLFTRMEVARLLGVSSARLSSLDRNGVVSPSGRRRGRRAYTFTDLIAMRTAQGLLDRQVRLRDVTRAVAALRKSLPSVSRPLVELKIASDGKRVVVYSSDGAFEPVSGQMLLDLEVSTLRDDVVRLLRPSAGKERARTAYELYLHASQLDEDPETMAEAESLYAQALDLDPWLSIAYTNLGNIRFRRHQVNEAEGLYRKALSIDPRQPEAQYNLGYVMLERGEAHLAIPLFRGAIDSDPKFSDAYFNLAMAFEQLGDPSKARPYWRSYIDLEPEGTWTEIARRHLS